MSRLKELSVKKQRLVGVVVSGLQILISVFSGLLFTPFLISSLGQVEYGLYQLLYSAIGYVAILDLGLGSTITRYVIKYDREGDREQQKSVVTMCLYLYFALSLIAFLAVVLVSFGLSGIFTQTITADNIVKARTLFIIMGFSSCVSLFDHAFVGVLYAYEKYTVTKGIRMIRDVSRMGILFFLFKMGHDSLAIVVVDLALVIIITIIDAIIGKEKIKCGYLSGKKNIPLLKSILVFSFYAFLQVIVSQVNNSIDRLLLGRFSTLFLVGMYGVAMQLYNMFCSFGNIFGGLTLPIITKVVCDGNSDEVITTNCIKYSRLQCLMLLPLLSGFALFGQQFIDFWMKGKYDSFQLWIVILIIVTPNILEWIETPIFNVMKAKNLQKTRSLLLIFVTVANLFLTIWLVKYNAIYGAAIGTAISFVIGNNILSNFYYHKKVGVNMKKFFAGILRGIFPAWIISILSGLLIRLIPGESIVVFLIKCLIYVLVYGLLIFLIGLNLSEKDLCITYLRRILKKKIA
jgi:O-antigen/teichoic acid export membrane protein